MKPQTQWLICILGLSAFTASPAVAQTYRLEKFFNGTPPYDGDSLNSARNPIGDMEAFIYQEAKPIITIEFEAEDKAPAGTPAETPVEAQEQTPAETLPAEPQNQAPAETLPAEPPEQTPAETPPAEPPEQMPAETPDDSNEEPKREIIYEAEPTNPQPNQGN
jgi:outer membrane biosynthesis protein TonB